MTSAIVYQPCVQPYLKTSTSLFEIFQRESSEYCAKFVLQQPACVFDNEWDSTGYLLIHRVCLRGDSLVLAALLQIGCDPSARNNAGMTGVHLAAMRGHVTLLHMLFQAGASLEQEDNRGKTALHHAAVNNQVITVAWLLRVTQIDWTTTVDHSGNTPLHLACAAGHRETVRFLLDTCRSGLCPGKWDPMTRDQAGNTCLHAAFTTVPPASTYGASSSNAIASRAANVIWPLLSTPPPDSGDHVLSFQTTNARNHRNETPLDLAVQSHAGFNLYCLLSLARVFSTRFRPRLAYTLFIWTYRIVWLAHLLLPGFIVTLSFGCAHWSQCNWVYVVGAGLAAASSLRQRHRLDDATDRQNPYFFGAFLTGFAVTAYASMSNLAAFVDSSSAVTGYAHYLIAIMLVSLGAVSISLLYRLVFWRHPILPSTMTSNRTLPVIASTEADHARQRLSLLPDSNTDHSMRTVFQFSDLYCAQCDVFLSGDPAVPIKHCRLCERCRSAMDHHCLFVMNCITQANLRLFVLLLLCTLGFMASYCLFTILHCVHVCQTVVASHTDDYHYAWLMCVYRRFTLPVLLIVFHLVTGMWLLMLLSEQAARLVRDRAIHPQPRWKHRGGLRVGFCQCVRMMRFALFGSLGRRSNAYHTVPEL